MKYNRDQTPRFIQRPRYITGVILLCSFVVSSIVTDPIWFERFYDDYRAWFPLANKLVIFGVGLAWLILFEIRLIWKKERCNNQVCHHCGYNVRGISSDTCPECGFDEVARGVRAAKRTYGFAFVVGPICKGIQQRLKESTI